MSYLGLGQSIILISIILINVNSKKFPDHSNTSFFIVVIVYIINVNLHAVVKNQKIFIRANFNF